MKTINCMACGKKFEHPNFDFVYCEDCREREHAKSMKKMHELTDPKPFEMLAAAIIKNEVEHYMIVVRAWHRAYTVKDKRNRWIEICEMSKWFKGEDFRLYADHLDGAALQRQCNKKVKGMLKRITKEKMK